MKFQSEVTGSTKGTIYKEFNSAAGNRKGNVMTTRVRH